MSLEGETVLINLRDITHRDRLEKERQKAARLNGVLELAGAAVHELNQPLTSLLLSGEMMQLYQEPQDLQRQAVRMRRDATQLARLVERFGRIVRYETKEYMPGRRIIDLDKAAPSHEDSKDILKAKCPSFNRKRLTPLGGWWYISLGVGPGSFPWPRHPNLPIIYRHIEEGWPSGRWRRP